MKQKEVDAIVLEIFNICRKKGLNFQLQQTGYIEVQDFDYKTLSFKLNIRSCIDTSSNIFEYKSELSTKLSEALKQVKQYKK